MTFTESNWTDIELLLEGKITFESQIYYISFSILYILIHLKDHTMFFNSVTSYSTKKLQHTRQIHFKITT